MSNVYLNLQIVMGLYIKLLFKILKQMQAIHFCTKKIILSKIILLERLSVVIKFAFSVVDLLLVIIY